MTIKSIWQPKHKVWYHNNDDDKIGSPRQLPKVKIGKKIYFVDARLNELRNIKDFSDSEKMEGSEQFYVDTFGTSKSIRRKK